ncbi:MAG: flagellar hook-associated protein FlgK [Candidatus Omnitrophica bacterium]|nr:flagellar hook-associated protein FlgK [Candidatus Omnitrophota bacterium]
MVTLFGIIHVGSSGLSAAQAGLNVTGNNISNADTEGYSRQRIDQISSDSIILSNGAMGQGTEVVSVERIRDMLLESQINNAKSDQSYYEKLDIIYNQLETILNDPLNSVSDDAEQNSTSGLNNLLAQFFDAFNALSTSPESPETRITVIEAAESLANEFSTISRDLESLLEDLNSEVKDVVAGINRKTSEIASLNKQISAIENGSRVNANDYRDRRDQLINELSELIPISTTENSNGSVNVALAGQKLVDNNSHTPLQLEITDSGETGVRVGKNGLDVINNQIREGKLGAIFEAREEILPTLLHEIDQLAQGIIVEVNQIVSRASGIEGYQSVESHFDFPGGSGKPGALMTLEKIFAQSAQAGGGANSDLIQDGSFSIRIADKENHTLDDFEVSVEKSDTLYDLVQRIDSSDGVVQMARSALKFDPIYTKQASSAIGVRQSDIDQPVSSLAVLSGAAIAETPGSYSFEIHLRNVSGGAVDGDASTPEIDPFIVTIDGDMTLDDIAAAVESAGGGQLRAQLASSPSDPNKVILQINGVQKGSSISIQNDSSGLIEALDFGLTDPSKPLVGGSASEASTFFSGSSSDSLLGSGSPSFNTVFSASSPAVVGEGTFELVVVNDQNKLAASETITISSSGISTLDDLANAIESVNSHLSVEITDEKEMIIRASNNYTFFFQNDETGLIDAMGFSDIDGYGQIGGQPFQDGSFEIVVVNEGGVVTNIVEAPVHADPSYNGGLYSLNDIVDQINQSLSAAGAPLKASLVEDPTDPTRNQLQITAEEGYEFTFRSDDSLLLSALGFMDGAVLETDGGNPILGAENVVAVGDSIGGLVRAEINEEGNIKISTSGSNQLTFTGDDSNFLAAAGINALFTGDCAGSMSVNEDMIENFNLLGASANGAQGGNEAALAVAELQNKTVFKNMTLNDYYRTIIAKLGSEGNRTDQLRQSCNDILTELETLREQESGVSLDEESINIIRYQQAYQAAAQFIKTIDELMDVVINRIGA